MKYNDYIFSFTLEGKIFQVSLRIEFTTEVEQGSIHQIILENAVKKAKEFGFDRTQEKDITFNFITVLYSNL